MGAIKSSKTVTFVILLIVFLWKAEANHQTDGFNVFVKALPSKEQLPLHGQQDEQRQRTNIAEQNDASQLVAASSLSETVALPANRTEGKGSQKPVQVVQKTVSRDKDGKKEEYVVYYYYYYDDDKNKTQESVESLETFDEKPLNANVPTTSTTSKPAIQITESTPMQNVYSTSSATASTASPSRLAHQQLHQSTVGLSTTQSSIVPALAPELNQARRIESTQDVTRSPTTTTTQSTVPASSSSATSSTTEPPTQGETNSEAPKKAVLPRRKNTRPIGHNESRRKPHTTTTPQTVSNPVSERRARPTRPARVPGSKRRTTTTAAPASESAQNAPSSSPDSASDGEKASKKKFGGGPRPRASLRRTTTSTAAPSDADGITGSSATTTAVPKVALSTRGTAGGLFGRGQGIRGPRPKLGRKHAKKTEETEEKPEEKVTTKIQETKVSETAETTTSPGPVRARTRQRHLSGHLSGGRTRPGLKKLNLSSTTEATAEEKQEGN